MVCRGKEEQEELEELEKQPELARGEEGSAIKQSGLAHVQHCGKSGTRFLRANQRIICSCNH